MVEKSNGFAKEQRLVGKSMIGMHTNLRYDCIPIFSLFLTQKLQKTRNKLTTKRMKAFSPNKIPDPGFKKTGLRSEVIFSDQKGRVLRQVLLYIYRTILRR